MEAPKTQEWEYTVKRKLGHWVKVSGKVKHTATDFGILSTVEER